MAASRVARLGLTGLIVACDVLAVGCAGGDCPEPPRADPPVAHWFGGGLRRSELEAEIGPELRELETRHALERYELLVGRLEAHIDRQLLELERTRRGLGSIDELFDVEAAARTPDPAAAEVEAGLERMEVMMPGVPRDQLRPRLVAQLREEAEADARVAFLEELREAAGLRVDLPYPDLPRVDVPVRPFNPVAGGEAAPVTVVEFFDFQCLFCKRALPVVARLLREHPEDVRVVYKDFPSAGHFTAPLAAVAAHCADQQGRHAELSELLHLHSDHLGGHDLRRYAAQVGLDPEGFEDCMADPTWGDRVRADRLDGLAAGVIATPTFFVNGLMVRGDLPYTRLEGLIEAELQRVAKR